MRGASRQPASYALGLTEATWLLALVTVPLFFNTHSSRVFEADKATLVRCLAGATLILLALTPRPLTPRPEGPAFSNGAGLRKGRSLLVPVVAFMGSALLSTAFSIAPRTSLLGSYHRLQGLMTILAYLVLAAAVVATVKRRDQVDRAVTVAVLASFPAALYGIVQYLGSDPLPWAGETRERVSGPAGHPTFLASHLMLIAPLALGRLVLAWRDARRWSAYAFVLGVDLLALWLTGSRGAFLGLLAALFFFFALLLLRERRRALALGGMAAWGVVVVLLILLNVPRGPLEALRDAGRLARFSDLIDFESGTVRGRALIWRAALDLMRRSEPLPLVGGGHDGLHSARWLVGYGPETLRFVFPQVAPPELAGLEDPTFFTDSAHNAMLDSLVASGALGFLASLALIGAVLYHGVKWTALPSAEPRSVLVPVAGGATVGAIVLGVIWGPAFLGIALPLGMVLGLAALVAVSWWKGRRPASKPDDHATRNDAVRGITLVSLFSALIGHLVESQFGVATTTTELLFWVLLALLWVLAEKDLERTVPDRPTREAGVTSDRFTVGLSAALATAALWVLAYDFLRVPEAPAGTLSVLARSLGLDVMGRPAWKAMAMPILVGLSWLVPAALVFFEEAGRSEMARTLGAALVLSATLEGGGWLLAAWLFSHGAAPSSMMADPVAPISLMVAALFGLGLWLAACLAQPSPRGLERPRMPLGALGAGVALGVVPLLMLTSLRVVQADMAFSAGQRLADLGDLERARSLHDRAVLLCPWGSRYRLEWGKVLVREAGRTLDTATRDRLFAQAEEVEHEAQRLGPEDPETAAALARLHLAWAALSSEPPLRARRARMAERDYEDAVRLSPHEPDLWNEAAALALDFSGRLDLAAAHLERSLALDPTRESTHLLRRQLEGRLPPPGAPD